jgi:hypothetical protein
MLNVPGARVGPALTITSAVVSIAAALACSNSSSTYQGGGRMLQPPGSNGFSLQPVDAAADTASSDQASQGEVEGGTQE